MNRIKLLAPAKVNLYLAVVGRRKDGYHNIITWLHKIRLFDTITLKKIPDRIRVYCNYPDLPLGRKNLAYKAAELLKATAAIPGLGVRIQIIKRIPPGSGLGGGSSDAAAVLVGLNKLWQLHLPRQTLAKLAKLIGADVPFLVSNYNSAIATGIGERLRPVNTKTRYWLVVAIPGKGTSTRQIYQQVKHQQVKRLTNTKPDVKLITCAFRQRRLKTLATFLHNDLEPIAIKLCPDIGQIKEKLKNLGGEVVLMSGSGSSVFALTTSKKEAIQIRRKITTKRWKIFVVRSL